MGLRVFSCSVSQTIASMVASHNICCVHCKLPRLDCSYPNSKWRESRWLQLYLLTRREKLNDSIRATRAREGCLLSGFRATIEVNQIKIPSQLTTKTTHIHIFYFLTISLFYETKWKIKTGLTRDWLTLTRDSRLTWVRGWLGIGFAVG